MEKATSPQALPRPQCHLLFKGLPTQLCEDIPKGRERPGLLPFLSLANQSTCASPPPTIISSQGEQTEFSGIAPCRQVDSRCVQLDPSCPIPWSFTCQRRALGRLES